MAKLKERIGIIGAGISGLTAALILEKAGYAPVIFEASSSVGGRMKTSIFEGYQLDHGFQVLLDAYPKTREYLDYEALNLQKLQPGAMLFGLGRKRIVGDPSRNGNFLLPTLKAGVGTISDYIRLLKLHLYLKSISVAQIFETEDKSTLQYLRDKGFTDKIINAFFKPFFSGIFLEAELDTSCRMFQFVFKMFGSGFAVIPEAGMGAIPRQLAGKLKNSNIRFNTPVAQVREGVVILENGKEIAMDRILIATDHSSLVAGYTQKHIRWHGCDALYFETPERTIIPPIIGLIANNEALINNIFYPTSIATAEKGPKELLSVTIVKKHGLDENTLVKKVEEELHHYCGITTSRFLKRYKITNGLPAPGALHYQGDEAKCRVGNTIFLAGDHLLYGSTNAAMTSGEMAAKAMLGTLPEKA